MWTSSAQRSEPDTPLEVDGAIVQLLSNRYGDGFVYLSDQQQRGLYEQAKHLGLICSEGYLTPVGRSLIRRSGQD